MAADGQSDAGQYAEKHWKSLKYVTDNVIVYRVTLGRGGYGSTKLSGTRIGDSVDGNPVRVGAREF